MNHRLALLVAAVSCFAGCGTPQTAPASLKTSYASLAQADEALSAKNYADALGLYDSTIASGTLQPDVHAEALVKRAVCKLELGDKPGARVDLAKAEEGGAVGEEYQNAFKRMSSD